MKYGKGMILQHINPDDPRPFHASIIRIVGIDPWYYWEFFDTKTGMWEYKENNTSIEQIENNFLPITELGKILYEARS
jgi:hypothetical protein